MKSELFGKKNRIANRLIECGSLFLIGMNGIAVTAQRTDFHIILFNRCNKLVELFLIVEKCLGIAVCVSREAAAAKLDHLNAERFEIFKCLLKRKIL